MAETVGEGQIVIGADTSNLDADLQKKVSKSGEKGGGFFSTGFGKAMKVGVIGTVATVGASAAAVFGTAMSKGFARAGAIEDAQAKLRGLGHEAESVESIMDNVRDSVTGTAYGLGEATTVAANMVAAGIEPGEKLTATLATLADTASITGSGFDEMGSIFSKMAANGRLTGEAMAQLTDRGLPVLQMLKDEYNLTTEEAQKWVKDGKVSFEMFSDLMEKNIGDAAENAGQTFSGASANIGAALGRLGEKFAKPIMDTLRDSFNAAIPALDAVGEALDPVAEKFGTVLAEQVLPKVEAGLAALPGFITDVSDGLSGLKSLLDGDFTEQFASAFNVEEDSPLVDVIMSIGDAWRNVTSAFEEEGGGFDGLLAAANQVITELVDWLTNGGMDMIVEGLLSSREKMLDAALKLFPVIIDGIVKVIPDIVDFIVNVLVPGITGAIIGALPLLIDGALKLFNGLIDGLMVAFPVVLQALLDLLPKILDTILLVLPQLIDGAIKLFLGIVDGLIVALPLILDALVEALPQITDALIDFLPDLLDAAIELFMALVDGLVEALPQITKAVTDILPELVEILLEMVPDLIEAGVTLFVALVPALLEALDKILETIENEVIPQIIDSLKEMMPKIKDQGTKWLTSLEDGINKGWANVKVWFKDLWDQLARIVSDKIDEVRKNLDDTVARIKEKWDEGWGNIKKSGEDAWNWIRDTALGVWDYLADKTEDAFNGIKDAVEDIWNGIKKVVGTPINAVIRFVNDGIIGGYNTIAEALNMSTLGKIPQLAGFASGGYVDLPWSSSKRDPYLGVNGLGQMFRFEGEEFIVNRERTKRNRKLLEAINAGLIDQTDLPGFRDGGLVSFRGHRFTALFAGLIREAERMAGRQMHITQGGFRPRTSYSGTSHQGDALDITGNHRAFIPFLRKVGIAAWDRTGKGNWVSHTHGVPLPGRGRALGSAIWQAQDYLRGGDGLGGRDNGPRGGLLSGLVDGLLGAFKSGFDTVAGWFDDITGGVKNLFGGLNLGAGVFGELFGGVGKKLMDGFIDWAKEKLNPFDGGEELETPARGYAGGTRHAFPGLALVGEGGRPELIDLKGGERVYNGRETENILNGRAPIVIQNLNLPGITLLSQVEALLEELNDSRRVTHMNGG